MGKDSGVHFPNQAKFVPVCGFRLCHWVWATSCQLRWENAAIFMWIRNKTTFMSEEAVSVVLCNDVLGSGYIMLLFLKECWAMCRILIIYIGRAVFVTLLWHIDFGRSEKAKRTLHLELRRTCTLYISLLSKEMIFHYEHFAAYLYILLILTELHWVELRPLKVLFILWIPINIFII